MKFKLFFILFILSGLNLLAQDYIGRRYKKLYFNDKDTLVFDSLSVKRKSIVLYSIAPTGCIEWLPMQAKVVRHCNLQSLHFSYMVYPWNLNESKGYTDSLILKPLSFDILNQIYTQKINKPHRPTSNWKNIQQEGEFMRGITVGNNKDAALNSNLDIKFKAETGKNTTATAIIRDKQLPTQAQGITSNIEELNQIYFELKNPQLLAQAGDFIIQNNSPLFHYQKKVRGLAFEFHPNDFKTKIALNKNKGEFKRQEIKALNGNFRYFLTGKNGEMPITVLSASEKIYIDGKRQKRGRDYTIDYNTGELRFDSKNLLNNTMHIVAEFEYQTGDNLFSIYQNSEYNGNKWRLGIGYSGNWQSKGDILNLTNDSSILQEIYSTNNELSFINLSHFQIKKPNANELRYQMIDTTIANQKYDSVFVFSTDSNQTLYQVQFSFVGENKGSYIIDTSSINANIFKWVAPVNNKKQGNYSIYTPVSLPNANHYLNFYGEYKLKKGKSLSFDFVQNEFLSNRFPSPKNYKTTYAGSISYSDSIKMDSSNFQRYEYSIFRQSADFLPLEPLFGTEFLRKWDLKDSILLNALNLVHITFQKYWKNKFSHQISLSFLNSLTTYKAKTDWNLNQKWRKNEFKSQGDFSLDLVHKNQYILNRTELIRTLRKGNFHFQINNELNKNETDSAYFSFNSLKSIFQNDSAAQIPTKLELAYHWDIQHFSQKWLSSLWQINNKAKYNSIHFRIENQSFIYTSDKNQNNRTNFQSDFKHTSKDQYFRFDISASQLATQETVYKYRYQKVAAGQGYYTWIDYNGDSIQEDGEFEQADFLSDAEYLRFKIPTSKFYQIYNNSKSFRVFFDTQKWKKNSHFIPSVKMDYSIKNTNKSDYSILKYNQESIEYNKIQNLNFKYKHRKLFVKLKYGNFAILSNLNYGAEQTSTLFYSSLIHIRFKKNSSILLNIERKTLDKKNEFLTQKNFFYNTNSYTLTPQIAINKKLSLYAPTSYQQVTNTSKNTIAQIMESGISMRYKKQKTDFNIKLKYSYINHTLLANTALYYSILQTRQLGNNLDMEIRWKKNMNKLFSVDFYYQGRITDNQSVHTGNIQLIANL